MDEKLEELRKDFCEELKCIDFKRYDPHSQIFLRALHIGQMYDVLKSFDDSDDVEEELDGARKYFNNYVENGDTTFKEMASDELRHAGILIKKHLAKTSDDEEREKLNSYEKRRQEILKEISMPLSKD